MTRPPPSPAELARAADAFPELAGLPLAPLAGGLINATFAAGGAFILQRVHPIFAPEVHLNIAAVTAHLRARGEPAPVLLPARDGRPWVDLGPAGVWRAMTRLPGVSFHTVQSPAQARSAGALVARFHSALVDLDHTFVALRVGHDTPAHLRTLERALAEHPDHRLFGEVEPLAAAVLAGARVLPPPEPAPLRPCHGDLKFSNILFAGTGPEDHAVATGLIDLDTLAPMGLHHELGDAWRSWCNAAGEDTQSPRFDLAIFAASCEGFAAGYGASLDPAERDSLETGPERITLELCARFAADALVENYWGWDPTRFPARGEHNALRAAGQWRLYEAARATRARRRELLRRLG